MFALIKRVFVFSDLRVWRKTEDFQIANVNIDFVLPFPSLKKEFKSESKLDLFGWPTTINLTDFEVFNF